MYEDEKSAVLILLQEIELSRHYQEKSFRQSNEIELLRKERDLLYRSGDILSETLSKLVEGRGKMRMTLYELLSIRMALGEWNAVSKNSPKEKGS